MSVRVLLGGLVLALSFQLPAAAEPEQGPVDTSLVLTMVSTAPDRSTVPVAVSWRRLDGGPAPSGPVVLELRRTGSSTWQPQRTIEVVDGTGRADVVPRDDGTYRVRAAAPAPWSEVVSPSQTFDNVPTRRAELRVGHVNLPGPDKLARSSTRTRRAATLIRAADLDVVTFNELVGPDVVEGSTSPSAFAATVSVSLGSRWRLLTPTTRYNENYIAYRSDRLELVGQQPDRVVPGVGDGETIRAKTSRHVTSAILKDIRSNRPFLVATTHLVNDDRAGARTQAATVADEVARRSAGYPVMLAGDMNTSERLTAFRSVGLKDARRSARKATREAWSTYTRYSSTRPRRDARWIIDQVHVPDAWIVRSWRTELDLRGGRFATPRASDHALVWIDVVSAS